MTDTAQIEKNLQAPLQASSIKERKNFSGGGKLSYIESHHAIREANRIFGHLGWSRETLSCEIVCTSPYVNKGRDMVAVSYVARVRVTVHGVTRDGVGYGDGQAGADRAYSAHELAAKEAESDAMKRALMTFGDPFGLALYEKDKSKANIIADDPKSPSKANTRDLYKKMQAALDTCLNMEGLNAIWDDPNFKRDKLSLTPDWQRSIEDRHSEIKLHLQQKAA